MNIVNYQLPDFDNLPKGVVRYNRKLHKLGKNKVAHAHFIRGINVYDSNCEDCKGVDKPPYTPQELRQRAMNKQRYIDDYRKSQQTPEQRYIAELEEGYWNL